MRRKRTDDGNTDRKAAAAGETPDVHDEMEAYVFDGPFYADKAVEHLLELNHQFHECDRRWERAKSVASEAKNDRDAASNAISLLLDQIDRHKNGGEDEQPVLKTIPGSAEGSVN
jgi:hypothetical protein